MSDVSLLSSYEGVPHSSACDSITPINQTVRGRQSIPAPPEISQWMQKQSLNGRLSAWLRSRVHSIHSIHPFTCKYSTQQDAFCRLSGVWSHSARNRNGLIGRSLIDCQFISFVPRLDSEVVTRCPHHTQQQAYICGLLLLLLQQFILRYINGVKKISTTRAFKRQCSLTPSHGVWSDVHLNHELE